MRISGPTGPRSEAILEDEEEIFLPEPRLRLRPGLDNSKESVLDWCDEVLDSHRCALPVAVALCQSIIELAAARTPSEGHQTKMELVYQHHTGPRFRHRVQAIDEKFADMQKDLEKERKVMIKQWTKREEKIRGVIESTSVMYGELQVIAVNTIQYFDGLDVKMLDSSDGQHVASAQS